MHLGNYYLPVSILIQIGIIIVSAIVLVRVVRYFTNRYIHQSSKFLKVDPTKYKFFKNALTFIIYSLAIFGIIYTIPELRSLSLTLFAGAGIFAAIIGFGAQAAFSNIISGIFIVIFRPFRVGDPIQVGTMYFGVVEDITLRHTVIRDYQHQRIIMPNSLISSETVLNREIGDTRICRHVEIGISYDADIDKAIEIIRDEAENHPSVLDIRSGKDKKEKVPKVLIRVLRFEESSIILRAYVWTRNFDQAFATHTDLNYRIKKRFDKEGVEIPFPHRTVVHKEKGVVK